MRHHNPWRIGALATLALALVLVVGTPLTMAADNVGAGDVGGDPSALADSNIFQLFSTGNQLALVKRAFLADGTPIPTGSNLPAGTTVKFMIYVSNDGDLAMNDVSVRDALDTVAFAYQAGTLKVSNAAPACATSPCTALEEAAIYTAVNGGTVLTDGIGDDTGSFVSPNVDLGNANEATNTQLDITANATWAVMFTVKMN